MVMTLSELPLSELLTHLGARRATGTLTLEGPRYRKKAYLLDGLLGGVTSSNPRELLGHFLVGWGLISEEQVAEAMRLQEQLGTPLGRILERMGAVDGESLDRALRAQAEEALLEMFGSNAVEKRFLENVVPADRPLVLRLPLEPIVLEGLRREARLGELEERLGGLNAVPGRTDSELPDGLSGRELHILAEIDGERSIEAVALSCHLVPFHVGEFVARGVAEGFLEVASQRHPATEEDPEAVEAEGHRAIARGELRRAWELLQRLRAGATDQATRFHALALERELGEGLARRRLAGHLIPHRGGAGRDRAAPTLDPEAAFVLTRVNGTWSLREIQRITPLEELHFFAVVASLVDAKQIELRHPRGGPASPLH